MHPAVFNRFCEDVGITDMTEANVLIRLATAAEVAQIKEHNGEGGDSTFAIKRFEKQAERHGCKVAWPGLTPVLIKGGKTIHLPD